MMERQEREAHACLFLAVCVCVRVCVYANMERVQWMTLIVFEDINGR